MSSSPGRQWNDPKARQSSLYKWAMKIKRAKPRYFKQKLLPILQQGVSGIKDILHVLPPYDSKLKLDWHAFRSLIRISFAGMRFADDQPIYGGSTKCAVAGFIGKKGDFQFPRGRMCTDSDISRIQSFLYSIYRKGEVARPPAPSKPTSAPTRGSAKRRSARRPATRRSKPSKSTVRIGAAPVRNVALRPAQRTGRPRASAVSRRVGREKPLRRKAQRMRAQVSSAPRTLRGVRPSSLGTELQERLAAGSGWATPLLPRDLNPGWDPNLAWTRLRDRARLAADVATAEDTAASDDYRNWRKVTNQSIRGQTAPRSGKTKGTEPPMFRFDFEAMRQRAAKEAELALGKRGK